MTTSTPTERAPRELPNTAHQKESNVMQTLTRATLPVETLATASSTTDASGAQTLPTKAIQFGEGNFLRGFVEWQLQQMNKQGLFNGGVTIVQPLASGLVAAQGAQDDLFTVLLEGKLDGHEVQSHEIITVVTGTVDPYTDYAGYLALAENDDIEFIFSNTTEAGIAYNGDDLLADGPQKSFPGKLTALLYRRFELGKAGFQIIPCELIEHNGDRLRDIVLQLAELWNLGEGFTRWISDENVFYSSLVDRIVPGYPKDRAAQLAIEFGYTDNFIVKAEPFLLWVIEGPQELVERLPLAKAGLNVIVTDDMTPYRERKVFLLNGPHTVMALLARLAGVLTVREVMQDAEFGPLIDRVMYNEIIPVLDLPHSELAAYAESVKERFDNPFMNHELASIALNSASKFKSRLLPILLATQRATVALPPRITLALAALLLTYSGDAAVTFSPVDGDEVLETFRTAAATDNYVETILANAELWGTDLTTVPHLVTRVIEGLESLRTRGVRASIANLI
ncbi:tagaturonate reductase [Glaciihabitans tibetensis]|uniref:Tagaturonate reductase n=1 Tax=Glaciihabitans tibetensis TaxID=1266600 RepID=A0A2T0VE33_9MICO|nr:tagaturonate reductase [Glaciihabitans tibetensis]PRY68449.1 tagaturonate reductase [Glaciihabitans tibetensis]